jgi:uncharacterized lipoprotein YajG
MPMKTLKNSLLLLTLVMLTACQTPRVKPAPQVVAIAQAKTSTASASVAVHAAIDDSKGTITEIKKIRTAQDRVDAKSVLILKWLEFQK